MKDISQGMFARSLAGHDAGKLYMIWRAEQDLLYLIDGKNRTIENPKKKKRKHVQVDYRTAPEITQIITAAISVRNEAVRKAIRCRDKGGDR
ncbi:MAG: KOW domain-containing RNA-binding protein [Eubacterium sp.]|nr:KOW domain-containing RNA-binding protein [Eubacterium sp.]